jgi:hypothetical protein
VWLEANRRRAERSSRRSDVEDAPSLARGPDCGIPVGDVLEPRRGAFKGLLPCARFSLARTAVSGQGEKDVVSPRVSGKRPGTSHRAEGSALSSVGWTLSLRFRCRRPRRFRSRVQYTSGSAVQARSFSAEGVAGSTTLEKSPS